MKKNLRLTNNVDHWAALNKFFKFVCLEKKSLFLHLLMRKSIKRNPDFWTHLPIIIFECGLDRKTRSLLKHDMHMIFEFIFYVIVLIFIYLFK